MNSLNDRIHKYVLSEDYKKYLDENCGESEPQEVMLNHESPLGDIQSQSDEAFQNFLSTFRSDLEVEDSPIASFLLEQLQKTIKTGISKKVQTYIFPTQPFFSPELPTFSYLPYHTKVYFHNIKSGLLKNCDIVISHPYSYNFIIVSLRKHRKFNCLKHRFPNKNYVKYFY
jgi:hypothetical protein